MNETVNNAYMQTYRLFFDLFTSLEFYTIVGFLTFKNYFLQTMVNV